MAHSISAKKRIRQNITCRARNRWRLRTMREAVTVFHEKTLHGTSEEATNAFRAACRLIDKTAGKGVIHKNTAARTKSRLSARLKAKSQSA